jgi:hypothetical protein
MPAQARGIVISILDGIKDNLVLREEADVSPPAPSAAVAVGI